MVGLRYFQQRFERVIPCPLLIGLNHRFRAADALRKLLLGKFRPFPDKFHDLRRAVYPVALIFIPVHHPFSCYDTHSIPQTK